MTLVEILTHGASVLTGLGGALAYGKERERRKAAALAAQAAAHGVVAARSAEVTASHRVVAAGIEVSAEQIRILAARVGFLESALSSERDARQAERDLHNDKIVAMAVRAERAEQRAEAAEAQIKVLSNDLRELRREAMSQGSSLRADDPSDGGHR